MTTDRVLYGRERRVPVASGSGTMGQATRWRLCRDGLGEIISKLPLDERGLGNRLGEVWAYLDSRCDGSLESGGSWPTLF